MASTDATAIPVKNQAYRVTFPIWDADGDLVTGAASLDSEVSKDGGTFADCTNEATEIATSSGMYYLDLTATEMNADTVAIIVKTGTAGAKTTPIVLYPQEAGDINVDVTYWNGSAVATPTVAGVPEVDITHYGGSAGAFASGRPEVNTSHIAGSAVSTSSAQLGVNVVNWKGSAAATVDSAGYPVVTIKDGTGAGEIALTSGAIDTVTTVNGLASNTVTAAALAADAVTEIQSGLSTLDAAGVRSAVGLASANLDTQLSAIDNFIDTEIAAIQTTLQGLVLAQGTIGATGNSTTAVHLAGLTYGDDEINNYLLVLFDVSESEYHSRWIEDWANTGDLATVATLPFTPQNSTDLFWLLPVRQDVTGGSGLDAAGVRAAIGLASANLDTQLAAIDDAVDTEVAAIVTTLGSPAGASVSADIAALQSDTNDIQGRLPAALVSGRIDASVGAMASDTLTSAALAASAVSEIQSGLSTLTAAQVNSEVDTALADARLDELLNADSDIDGAAPPTVGSVFHELMSKTTGSFTYDQTTDSLEAVRDRGDAAWVTATGFSTLDAAGVRSAVGLASANLDTQLGAIDDLIDTEVAAIKAKTDNLPTDPADQSAVEAAITTATSGLATAAALSTVSGLVDDLEGRLTAARAGYLDNLNTGVALTNTAIDAILDRANGVETGYTLRQAFRLMAAALLGELSGAATTTITIRDMGDTKTRITAVVDSDGNRTALTLDAS